MSMPSVVLARPSTSPIPMLVEQARQRNNLMRSGRGLPPTSGQLQQPKLRPLPANGRRKTPAAPNGILMNMMIEGAKTGEEKTFSTIERREATERRESTATPTIKSAADISAEREKRDQQRIRKLETELKRSQDQSRHRTDEIQALKARIGHLESKLVQSQEKNAADQQEFDAELGTKDAEVRTLQDKLSRMQFEMDSHLKEQQSRAAADAARKQRESTDASVMLEKRVSDLQTSFSQEKSKLSKEAEDWRAKAEELQKQMTVAKADMVAANSKHQSELESVKQRELDLAANLRSVRGEAVSNEAKLSEWKTRIEAINSYIVKICRPDFTVVKDETLTPLQPGETDGSDGFVLVPLKSLLEGYSLLPGDMKQGIATEYEQQQAAKPKPPAPRSAPSPDELSDGEFGSQRVSAVFNSRRPTFSRK